MQPERISVLNFDRMRYRNFNEDGPKDYFIVSLLQYGRDQELMDICLGRRAYRV